ncbi:MAG: tetratricopeptide repeat protein [Rhodospirillales bacterium]|nr:tetratricopeptide repeat protein [Rhodospirillales bacterium]
MDSTALAEPKVLQGARLKWAAIACGVLAVVACSNALAGDPIADALSLVAQERFAEAHEALEPLVEREPDAPGLRLLQGILNAREGKFDEAVAIFESLRNDHPAMFEAHNNLAVLYAKLGRLDEARKTLVAALELRPDAVVYANLGDVYLQLAEQAYTRAHDLRVEESAAPVESEHAAARPEPTATAEEPAAVPIMQGEEASAIPTTQVEEASAVPTTQGEEASADPMTQGEEAFAIPTTQGEEAAAVPTTQAEEPAADPTPEEEGREATVEAETPEIPEEPEAPPTQATVAECIRAEWFKNSDAAYEAAAWMRARGATEIKVRQEEREAVKNHHVYIPALASRAEAAQTADELRSRGVSDIWIFGEGERANGISLGVFRNERYMRRRVAEIEALGYPVVSAPNMKAVSVHAIEAGVEGDRAAFDDAWTTAFPEQTTRTIDCADRT